VSRYQETEDWVLPSENEDAVLSALERRSIPAFLFCNLLLHKSLLNIGSLSQIGPILFSSPDTLRMLGFNMCRITVWLEAELPKYKNSKSIPTSGCIANV